MRLDIDLHFSTPPDEHYFFGYYATPQIDSSDTKLLALKVDFIDSSGVGALLGVYKRLSGDEPNLQLKRLQPPVQSVIELLRLHTIFDISS